MAQSHPEMREWRKNAERQGWRIELTKSGHWKWHGPQGQQVVTGNDRIMRNGHQLDNTKALLKRQRVPIEPPPRLSIVGSAAVAAPETQRSPEPAPPEPASPDPSQPKRRPSPRLPRRAWTDDERRLLAQGYGAQGQPNPEHRQALAYRLGRTTQACKNEISRMKLAGELERYRQGPVAPELELGPLAMALQAAAEEADLPQAVPLEPPPVEPRAEPEPTLAQAGAAIAALDEMLMEFVDDYGRFARAHSETVAEFRGKLVALERAQGAMLERLAAIDAKLERIDPLGPFRAKLQGR